MEQLMFEIQENSHRLLSNDLLSGVKEIIDKVCCSQNVDTTLIKIVHSEKTIKDKVTGTKRKEIVPDDFSVWVCEPVNLAQSDRAFHIKKKVLKTTERFEVEFLYRRKDKVNVPVDATEKLYKLKQVDENGEVYYTRKLAYWFPCDSLNIVSYLTSLLDMTLKEFSPKEHFGCCEKYIECSDETKCLHNDKFYAKACQYRENLEKGRIFYGKNRNV